MKISENFRPDEKTYKLLERNGIPREFCQQQIKEFIDYWIVEQTERKSWDRTFINRCKQLWEWERHKWHQGKRQGIIASTDLFDGALDKLKGVERPDPPRRVYHKPKPISLDTGESMTPEQAFDKLRQQGII